MGAEARRYLGPRYLGILLPGLGVPGGKLLTYAAYATKQTMRTYTLEDTDANKAPTGDGDGRTTTARFGQFSDKTYYLYLLETLDYTPSGATTAPKSGQQLSTSAWLDLA